MFTKIKKSTGLLFGFAAIQLRFQSFGCARIWHVNNLWMAYRINRGTNEQGEKSSKFFCHRYRICRFVLCSRINSLIRLQQKASYNDTIIIAKLILTCINCICTNKMNQTLTRTHWTADSHSLTHTHTHWLCTNDTLFALVWHMQIKRSRQQPSCCFSFRMTRQGTWQFDCNLNNSIHGHHIRLVFNFEFQCYFSMLIFIFRWLLLLLLLCSSQHFKEIALHQMNFSSNANSFIVPTVCALKN